MIISFFELLSKNDDNVVKILPIGLVQRGGGLA